MKKHRTIIVVALVIIAIPLLIIALHNEDSNYLNFKYCLWKIGFRGYDPAYVNHVISDISFRKRLEGKTLNYVKDYFPDLRKSLDANDYQRSYIPKIKDEDYYWIGDSAMTIVFKDGRLQGFHLWKG